MTERAHETRERGERALGRARGERAELLGLSANVAAAEPRMQLACGAAAARSRDVFARERTELSGEAFLVGVLVTAGLAWYLSGRITRPVLALAKAADEVAEGNYDVAVPELRGRDEIGDLAAFLCGPNASYITGQLVQPNGGQVMW
jgi:HAMP domain-containing protein